MNGPTCAFKADKPGVHTLAKRIGKIDEVLNEHSSSTMQDINRDDTVSEASFIASLVTEIRDQQNTSRRGPRRIPKRAGVNHDQGAWTPPSRAIVKVRRTFALIVVPFSRWRGAFSKLKF